jgi:hypothetical protein
MTGARDQLTLFHMPCIEPLSETWHRNCQDCDVDTVEVGEYYMVHDGVWPIDPQGGVLCIRCLEGRIGRRLVPEDFLDCPLNSSCRSERLASRLGLELSERTAWRATRTTSRRRTPNVGTET